MALKNRSGFIFVKKVSIGDENNSQPRWGKQEKVGKEWKTTETYECISGKLVGIETESYEYEKGKKTLRQHQVILILKDGDDKYKISVNFSYMSRGMLNNLASITDFKNKNIELTLYKNKTDFDSCFVTCNGEKTNWALDASKLPNKDKDEERYHKSFLYFIDKIKEAIPEQEQTEIVNPEELPEPGKPEEETAVDDLPF
jgi:hypothetical protein